METIGERLRRRREELGLSIEQAAEATKFRPEMIEAVEEGRAGVFSAGVYRDGFIRTYAALLKLDGDSLLRAEKTEEERAHEAIRGIKFRPQRRRVSPRVLVIVLAVAAICVVAVVLISRVGKGGGAAADQSATSQLREVNSGAGRRALQPGQARRRGRGTASQDSLGDVLAKDSSSAAAAESLAVGGALPVAGRGPSGQLGQPAPVGQTAQLGQRGERGQADQVAVESRTSAADQATQQRTPVQQTQSDDQARVSSGAGAAPAETPSPEIAARTPSVETGVRPPVAAAQGGTAGEGAGTHTLEIVASRRSANFTVKSGDQVILDDYWLKRGERVVRVGSGPFFIVSLSDRHGVSMTLDGQPVRLPLSDDPDLFDWPIPLNP